MNPIADAAGRDAANPDAANRDAVNRDAVNRDAVNRLLLQREVEAFLYREANLLDDRRYDEWLDLLTDDIRYWVPMRRNVKFGELEREFTRAGHDINWFDEGKETLTQRVRQIQTGVHWAEEPLSRLAHLVTNVEILDAAPPGLDAERVSLRCRFIIYRNRVETETDILVGRREDTLRRVGGQWRIASRQVFLDQNVLLAKNLTFFF